MGSRSCWDHQMTEEQGLVHRRPNLVGCRRQARHPRAPRQTVPREARFPWIAWPWACQRQSQGCRPRHRRRGPVVRSCYDIVMRRTTEGSRHWQVDTVVVTQGSPVRPDEQSRRSLSQTASSRPGMLRGWRSSFTVLPPAGCARTASHVAASAAVGGAASSRFSKLSLELAS